MLLEELCEDYILEITEGQYNSLTENITEVEISSIQHEISRISLILENLNE